MKHEMAEIERFARSYCTMGFVGPNVTRISKEIQEKVYCSNALEKDSLEIQVFVTCMFVFLMAFAITGNSVVMWIIYKHKVMHHGFNYFLFNMAFADLLIASFNVGTSWTYNLYYDWWFGDLCILTSYVGVAPTTVSVFSMMALSWDRYQAVVNPLRKRPLSRRRSLYNYFDHLVHFNHHSDAVNEVFSFDVNTSKLTPRSFCESAVSGGYDHMLFFIQFAVPLLVLSFTFARIAFAFRITDEVTDNSSKGTSHTRAKSKAVKMLALMVLTFMFCWLPYNLYHTFFNNWFSVQNSKYIYLGIYWIAMSSSAYNPIIYCFANERFRIGFRYVFRWLPLVQCKREQYEYSQLFPEKLRSMAISMQKGRGNSAKEFEKKISCRDYSTAGFPYQPAPDIVQCVLSSEKKKPSKIELLSHHDEEMN
ncbi:unnamed protein product [Caenorhabditis auriculariae]|uniref:G-protein coupled receptors family 1 profile domain-containing protein n=1 Tax=Caenorhabditis auriculariae TaxID=2777116 RepID=A0A8S1HNT6_9PELO|nr:unnamed protein product [Caenorhabditis auriculariae]